MNEKQIALKWYLKGSKDADETSGTTHIVSDFETHFHLQYKKELRIKIENDFKNWQENNKFVYIVEDSKDHEKGYYSSSEKAK